MVRWHQENGCQDSGCPVMAPGLTDNTEAGRPLRMDGGMVIPPDGMHATNGRRWTDTGTTLMAGAIW